MTSRIAQEAAAGALTIGELAERTGVAPTTLRMWEQRHGFPVPERLPSGHRRYRESDVAVVADVVNRRDEGMRLDVAVEQAVARATAEASSAPRSVFADLRRRHPNLLPYRLEKSTLIGLSWAIEDECCAKAGRPHLFGAFQSEAFYAPSRRRWRELHRVASSAHVYADFPETVAGAGAVEVALPADSPMRREWTVVCDSVELPAALTAWEIPGQEGVPDRNRMFEALWTVDPVAVRDAARVCAAVALECGAPDGAAVLHDLAAPVRPGVADLASVTTLFNRVVAYVDEVHRRG